MDTRLNEPIVTAVQSMLTADLPAALATIDTGLPAPVNVYAYLPPVVMVTDYPTLGIGDGPSTVEDDIASSWTEKHSLLVVCHLQEQDPEALARNLRRYVQATVNVLASDRTLGGSAFGSGGYRVEPGPMLGDNPDKPQQFMAWSGVSFWAKRDED